MILAMLLALLAASAKAETIHLKDGTSFQGTITKTDADTVSVQIKKERIDPEYYSTSILKDTSAHDGLLVLTDGSYIHGTITIVDADTVGIQIKKKLVDNIGYAVAQDTSAPTAQKAPIAIPETQEEASRRRIAEDEPETSKQRARDEVSINIGKLTSTTQIQGVSGQDALSSPGSSFGMGYLHNVSPHIAIGFMWDVLLPGDHTSQILLTNANTTTHFQAFDGMGTVRLQLGSGKLRPYLLGGLGVYTAYMNITAQPRPGFVWLDTGTNETRTAVNSNATGLASAFQVGLDYDLSEHVTFGGFISGRGLGTATYAATADGAKAGLSGIKGSYSAGIFGGQIIGRF